MVHEGENHLALQDAKSALAVVEDVIKIDPGNPALRDLVISGFLVALKAWLQLEEYDTAIEKANKFVGQPMLNEVRSPKWIEAQYLLASAHERQAGKLKGSDVEKQKALREARLLASEIVKYPSDVQDDVRALLTRVGFVDAERKSDDEITDLATALEKATAAAQDYTASRETLAKSATEDERRELRKQLSAQRDLALAATQRALELADQSAEVDKLNQARFLLGYLNWEIARSEANEHNHSTRYYDAAVIGDFLGRRYPDHEHARQAAAIAMASYQLLGNQSSEAARRAAEADKQTPDNIRRAMDKAIETWSRHIDDVAQYITGKWPESQEASNAASNLASIAIQRGDYEKAVELVSKLKAGSPDRADAELRVAARSGRTLFDPGGPRTNQPRQAMATRKTRAPAIPPSVLGRVRKRLFTRGPNRLRRSWNRVLRTCESEMQSIATRCWACGR